MLMDTFGEYLTQILPAKCLENMKNFRQKYMCLENMKNFRQKCILKTSTGDVPDVDVLPKWEEIHISLEAEFL